MTQRIEGKMGTKRGVLVDERGLPLAVILDGANRHGVMLLQRALERVVINRTEAASEHSLNYLALPQFARAVIVWRKCCLSTVAYLRISS